MTGLTNFLIGKSLARGMFGKVYPAKDINKQIMVALKVQYKDALSKKNIPYEREESFHREVSNHPNIIKLLDAFMDDKRIFYVLELCRTDLFEYQQKCSNSVLSEDIAVFIVRQIASALDYCHSIDIIHNDVKPENILLKEENVAKLSDFGCSKYKYEQCSLMGGLIGTLDYVCPDKIKGKYDEKTDVWALGIVLYEAITGLPPFHCENNSMSDTYYKIENNEVDYTFISPQCRICLEKIFLKESDKRPEAKTMFMNL